MLPSLPDPHHLPPALPSSKLRLVSTRISEPRQRSFLFPFSPIFPSISLPLHAKAWHLLRAPRRHLACARIETCFAALGAHTSQLVQGAVQGIFDDPRPGLGEHILVGAAATTALKISPFCGSASDPRRGSVFSARRESHRPPPPKASNSICWVNRCQVTRHFPRFSSQPYPILGLISGPRSPQSLNTLAKARCPG